MTKRSDGAQSGNCPVRTRPKTTVAVTNWSTRFVLAKSLADTTPGGIDESKLRARQRSRRSYETSVVSKRDQTSRRTKPTRRHHL